MISHGGRFSYVVFRLHYLLPMVGNIGTLVKS